MQAGHHNHPGNGLHPQGKYGYPALGFGGFCASEKGSRSPSGESAPSPPISLSKRSSPPSRVGADLPRGMWDLHYVGKSEPNDEHMDVASPGHLPSRGEGLAA